jgi:hypothetical protein
MYSQKGKPGAPQGEDAASLQCRGIVLDLMDFHGRIVVEIPIEDLPEKPDGILRIVGG